MFLTLSENGKRFEIKREGNRVEGVCFLPANITEKFIRGIHEDEKGEYFLFHTKRYYLSDMTGA